MDNTIAYVNNDIPIINKLDQNAMIKQIFLELGINFESSVVINTANPYQKIVVKSEKNKITLKFYDNFLRGYDKEPLESDNGDGYSEEYFGQESDKISEIEIIQKED